MPRASGIIVAHNHPSGDARPSQRAIEVTRRLADASRALGICLCDHLVVAGVMCGELCLRDEFCAGAAAVATPRQLQIPVRPQEYHHDELRPSAGSLQQAAAPQPLSSLC